MNETVAPRGTPPDPASDADTWNIAKQYASLLGKIPTNFSTTIRTLMWDHQRGGDATLSPANRFLLIRLMRGPTMKAILYYATLTFHGEKITTSPFLSTSDLVKYFGTSELASLVGIVYAFRRIKRRCEPEKWSRLSKLLQEDLEIGAHLGYAIPVIAPSVGSLARSMRYLAVGSFLAHDQDGVSEYWRYCEQKGTMFDGEFELKRWGCTSVQVGATILQSLGFGRNFVHAYLFGLSSKLVDDVKEKEAYNFHISEIWIDALRRTAAPPQMTHKGKYYPLQTALHKLLFEVSQVLEKGSKHSWLDRGGKDISPEATPQLYQETLLEKQSPEELEQYYKKNLPPEILEGLSDAEIKELTASGTAGLEEDEAE